jgi:hypothetical protein
MPCLFPLHPSQCSAKSSDSRDFDFEVPDAKLFRNSPNSIADLHSLLIHIRTAISAIIQVYSCCLEMSKFLIGFSTDLM